MRKPYVLIQFEVCDRDRIEEHLTDAGKNLRARQVVVQPAPVADDSWPPGVHLERGRLTVDFSTAEGLLTACHGLLQVAVADWVEFQRRCGSA